MAGLDLSVDDLSVEDTSVDELSDLSEMCVYCLSYLDDRVCKAAFLSCFFLFAAGY